MTGAPLYMIIFQDVERRDSLLPQSVGKAAEQITRLLAAPVRDVHAGQTLEALHQVVQSAH